MAISEHNKIVVNGYCNVVTMVKPIAGDILFNRCMKFKSCRTSCKIAEICATTYRSVLFYMTFCSVRTFKQCFNNDCAYINNNLAQRQRTKIDDRISSLAQICLQPPLAPTVN